jgi:TonB family protein
MTRYFIFVGIFLAFCGCSDIDSNLFVNSDEYIPPPDDFVPVEEYPEMIYEEIPEYPRLAYDGGFTGSVIIQAYVNNEGIVRKAQAMSCTRPAMGFEEAAVAAAYKCIWSPAIQNGQPIGLWVSYRVDFVIE